MSSLRPRWAVSDKPLLLLAARLAPESCMNLGAPKSRAQGMPGAGCARSLACKIESTRASHHGHTRDIRHSPRNGFNGFLRARPGDRLCCLRRLARCVSIVTKLDISVGISGPHDFAVRLLMHSSRAPQASTASRTQRFVTIAKRPERRRDTNRYSSVSTKSLRRDNQDGNPATIKMGIPRQSG